ncbi:Putative protein without homology [Lacticaseibacillus rhamnosus Lc 705]|nr:Putative protein without homology [Lacticaseibacillus rhamnosus Lc 705]
MRAIFVVQKYKASFRRYLKQPKVQTKKPAKSAFSANRSGLNGTKTLSGGTS